MADWRLAMRVQKRKKKRQADKKKLASRVELDTFHECCISWARIKSAGVGVRSGVR